MKKVLFALGFSLVTLATVTGQRIDSKKAFGGYTYTQNGTTLTMGELVNRMDPDTEAYELMRSARSNYTFAQVLAVPGGALIGWPLGQALAGGDANWTLAAVGGGLIVATIPFSSAANKKSQAAVAMYNEGYTQAVPAHRPVFALQSTADGLGLSVRF